MGRVDSVFDRHLRNAQSVLDTVLVGAHRASVSRPTVGPDPAGAFPPLASVGARGLGMALPPVVPDTNILRNDIRRTCRDGQRTTLLNLANCGALRIFCPVHVVAEVGRRAEKFSTGIGVDTFRDVWQRRYLPLLRIIDGVPESALTATERARIARLNAIDPDDVPAAQLALVTGAFFLSNDKSALEAVYGTSLDRTRHHRWLAILQAGGNASEVANLFDATGLVGRVAAVLVGSLAKRVGVSQVGRIAALLVLAHLAASPRVRGGLRTGAVATLASLVAMYDRGVTEARQVWPAAAPRPQDVESLSDADWLLRSCLRAFSESPQSVLSARELTKEVAAEPASEARVRAVLRSHTCFAEPYRGQFQLGRPYRRDSD